MNDRGTFEGLFEKIFNPERVAVVGVSAQGFGFGRGIFMSLLSIGFSGELIPVNSRGGSIDGHEIFRRIEDIPGEIDFAIIAVPAAAVPEALRSCVLKGAAGAEILSSGFSESGTAEGLELDRQIRDIASDSFRIIGPNCFGIYSPSSGLTFLPGPDLSRVTGKTAFISQSGGNAIDLAHIGKWKGIGFRAMVSFGNGADLRETELLEFFTRDSGTDVVGMYIEGIEDGPRFLSALRNASSRKPVVVLKGGATVAGSRAAASHTASLGGSAVIWDAAIRQCNAVKAESLTSMSDILLAFNSLPPRQYRQMAVIGGGGALGVAAADMAETMGLELPELPSDVQQAILPHLPRPGSSARNPVDIANPYVLPDDLHAVITHCSSDRRLDILVVVQLLYHYKALALSTGAPSVRDVTPHRKMAEAVADASRAAGIPVIMVMPDYKREAESLDLASILRETRALLHEAGIPVFDELESAMKAVSAVSEYWIRRTDREARTV